MSPERPPKKSENLEIRLTFKDKSDLMRRAAIEGRTASDVVRGLISAHLASPAKPVSQDVLEKIMTQFKTHPARTLAALAGLAGAGLYAFGFSAATAGPDLTARFNAIDINADGMVTPGEYQASAMNTEFVVPPDSGEEPGDHAVLLAAPADTAAAPTLLVFEGDREAPDGHISWTAGSLAAFDNLDADGDGNLTFSEYEAYVISIGDRAFALFDRDGDGAVTLAELQATNAAGQSANLIDTFDANGDGILDRSEFSPG